MKKTILTPILALLDIVLLAVIIVSVRTAGSIKQGKAESSQIENVSEETSPVITTEVPSSSIESTVAETTVSETEQSQNNSTSGSSALSETVSDPVVSSETEVLEEENNEKIRAISAYDTHELPVIKDFKWVTPDILNGVCPSEAEPVCFEEALGGWKCYIIDDDTGAERLANMEISGMQDDLQLCIKWYYVRIGGKDGEAFEDNSSDSVFKGFVNDNGEIEAEGPGRILVADIYVIGDHMYAFGSINWPDGIRGILLLVRP